MPKKSIRIRWKQGLTAEAEGIQMHRGGIRILETEFGCPRGHSDTLYKLLHEGYPDTEKCIRMHTEAIRILEEGIRMPTTQKI